MLPLGSSSEEDTGEWEREVGAAVLVSRPQVLRALGVENLVLVITQSVMRYFLKVNALDEVRT